MIIRTLMALVIALSASCSTNYLGISVTDGDPAKVPVFSTFHVKTQAMPAFLGPVVVSNFNVAMAERGMQPVSEGGDAEVILRFEQETIAQQREAPDFGERTDTGGQSRFIARVVVEVRAADADTIVWRGSVQRLHTITPGDYMHVGRASIALLDSFRSLLKDYPVPGEA